MRAFLIALASFFVLAAPASAVSPDIVISQVYGGGGNSGATFKNDFIELYNRGTEPVPVTGWSVQYGSSGGTSWTNRTPLTGTIRPGRHYLVQEAAGTGGTQDLPTPNATGSIAMAAGSGKVALVTNNTNLTCAGDCDTAAGVRDFVGYGTANDSETAPAPLLSNTTAALRIDDTVDTDNNSADFDDGPPNPRNTPPPASITSSDPADGESDVPTDSDVTITFSGPVEATADAFAISCATSGAHAFELSGGPTEYVLDPTTDFSQGETCTVSVAAEDVEDSFSFSTAGIEGLRIHDIQGVEHRSPYENRIVDGVPGVVTAASTNGIWVQDADPDADARTSEGVFLFQPSARPPIGTAVLFSGSVVEFKASNWGPESLSLTEISRPTVTATEGGSPIAPTVVGQGGRIPPNQIIDNDSSGDVDDNPMFDPQQDGIDFHESLEGMLLQFNDAVATGPTNNFGEVSIVGDSGSFAGPRTARGGVIVRPGDFNPERFILDDVIGETPTANTGDEVSSPLVAVADYSFDNFKYYPLADATATGALQREVTQAPEKHELAVASMNVENLDPGDPAAKFEALAEILVDNMRSPDLVALEEVQDNNGAAAGDTDASLTYAAFIAAIQAVGGPTYEFRQINPAPGNQDGGEPNGNIRVGFLYRVDRGLEFVDRSGGDATTPTGVVDTGAGAELTLSPGRIDPANPAFANSRKPLAGEFRWNGRTVFAVANHFNSKGGDDPLFGRFQPPVRHTEVQRHQQATVVADFVEDVLAADKQANVIVLGDLNDFEFSETLDILEAGGLNNLMETLPVSERYSYVFEGNSQTLDQILVSDALMAPKPEYDSVHVNAEFHDQASDHDPQVARVEVTGRRH
jgi:uncharacterized protein